MNELFTFIIDYTGGTYISQINGYSPEDVMFKWLKNFDFQGVLGMQQSADEILQDAIALEKHPIALEGIQNTWTFSLLLDDELALVNFIKTSRD